MVRVADGRMLARFRADPGRVRVSIRQVGREWLVTISSRLDDPRAIVARATGPRKALAKALREADETGLPGVDLSMGWTYEHPQHPPVRS